MTIITRVISNFVSQQRETKIVITVVFILYINVMYEVPQKSVDLRAICTAQTQSELGLQCHRNTVFYSPCGPLTQGREGDERHPSCSDTTLLTLRGDGKGALSKAQPP